MNHYTEEVMNSTNSMRLSSYHEIATKLLNDRFILTALELHTELCEVGKELPTLKDYFGNPSNFENHQTVKLESDTSIVRSSSQTTLDSLDMARYSEDGSGIDERVAILEFELRKARESISALRANLTVVTDSESTFLDKVTDKIQVVDSPIKPHEQRALNFLVNEYLLTQSCKLTSITFNDENENQDFEDWQDVGLNIPKPNLLQIYREFYRRNDFDKPLSVDVSLQVNFNESILVSSNDIDTKMERNLSNQTIKEELRYSKQQIEYAMQDEFDVEQCIDTIDGSKYTVGSNPETDKTALIPNITTSDKFKVVKFPYQGFCTHDTTKNQVCNEEKINVPATLSLEDIGGTNWMKIELSKMHTVTTPTSMIVDSHAIHIPESFKQQLLNYSLINVLNSDNDTTDYPIYKYNIMTLESLINFLTKMLPTIVPSIVLNKRDEIIPLILTVIRLNSETFERNKLLTLLFNLRKKPRQVERKILLRALVTLVNVESGSIKPEEIITICWEQSKNKYPERRLLAVECCSAFAPYTSNAIKNSLMISMLQQILLEDKDPIVRVAVVRTLVPLIAFNNDSDKYFQCEELTLTALDDESSQVSDISSTILLPILAQWSLSLKRFLSHLFVRILSKLKILLKPNSHLHCSDNDHRNSEKAIRLINALIILLPHLIVCIVNNSTVKSKINENTPFELPEKFLLLFQSSITNPSVFLDDRENIFKTINTFLANDWQNNMWPELEWLNNKLLPDIVTMLKFLSITHDNMFNCLLTYLESLCTGFGRHVALFWIKNVFEAEMIELERRIMDPCHDPNELNNLTLIPVYMLILSTVNIEDLSNKLKHFVVMISNSGINISCLIITIQILLKQSEIIEQIIAVLWDGVVHQRANVRNTTAILLGNIIKHVPERIVIARIAPAIITLASDPDILVKSSTVIALGQLIVDCGANEAKDKGRWTLESIIKEMDNTTITQTFFISLISTLTNIAPNSPQHYLEDIIATQFSRISALALQQSYGDELLIGLIDAYSSLVNCPLNIQCITNVLLPGLGYLETSINHHLPHRNEKVRLLIREAELRLNSMRSIQRSTSGLSLSLTSTNVGQGVGDVRQKMTKIFTPKSHSPRIPSLFLKKKSK